MAGYRRTSPCGNRSCSSSTGIHEGLTFGRGRLDNNGFWQFPCRPCAEEWDNDHAGHVAQVGDSLLATGHTLDQVIEYVRQAEWLNTPAWPDTHRS